MLPEVDGEEAYWGMKQRQHDAKQDDEPRYAAIEMPQRSATGVVCAFFAVVSGFALIWHIWWLVAVGCVASYATFVVFAWRDGRPLKIPAREVAAEDRAHRAAVQAAA